MSNEKNEKETLVPSEKVPVVGFGTFFNEEKKKEKKERKTKKRESKEEELSFYNEEEHGYIALGVYGLENYIYSKYRKHLVILKSSDYNLKNMINILGRPYIEEFYSRDNSYDMLSLQEDLTNRCIEAGVYDVDNMKGYGIFKDPVSKNDLIINTSNIWGTSPDFKATRIRDKTIFHYEKDLKIEKNSQSLNYDDIKRIYNLFKTFNFTRKTNDQDLRLLLGWIFCAPFAGCLRWRTHGSLTGVRGSGKSTLQEIIKNILGGFAELLDGGSSEAGIRQMVGISSCALLLDESEADGIRLGQILSMLRSASSGSRKAMGTSDQKGNVFELKMVGLLSGIVPAKLNAADMSRFVRFEIMKRDEKIKNKDLIDIDFQSEFGKRMIMTMIKSFNLFEKILIDVRMKMLESGNDSRYADTFGSLVASSFLILNLINNDGSVREYKEKELDQYINEFNFDNEKEQSSYKDEEELFKIILSSILRDDDVKSSSIIKIIMNKSKSNAKGKYKNILGNYGIKTIEESEHIDVLIDCNDNKLKELIKGSRFYSGDLKAVLKRLDNAENIDTEISIGGIRRSRSSLLKIKLDKKLFEIDDINNEEDDDFENIVSQFGKN